MNTQNTLELKNAIQEMSHIFPNERENIEQSLKQVYFADAHSCEFVDSIARHILQENALESETVATQTIAVCALFGRYYLLEYAEDGDSSIHVFATEEDVHVAMQERVEALHEILDEQIRNHLRGLATYFNSIIYDNIAYIPQTGTVADYLISNAEAADQGYYEYLPEGFEPTERIREVVNAFILENYDYEV